MCEPPIDAFLRQALRKLDDMQPLTVEIDRLRAEVAALPEWKCPECGAVTRARMADH